jgi:hypothetical protein
LEPGRRTISPGPYINDFGDGWEHTIKIERIDEAALNDLFFPQPWGPRPSAALGAKK